MRVTCLGFVSMTRRVSSCGCPSERAERIDRNFKYSEKNSSSVVVIRAAHRIVAYTRHRAARERTET